jgi:D-amino-acid oxidase
LKLVVLGAGVNGLTSALALRRAGHEVEIWAKDLTPQTTSDVAAAFWEPYAAYPVDKVTKWAARSFEVFEQLARASTTGVRRRRIIKYTVGEVEPPEWVSALTDYRENEESLPPGHKGCMSYDTFVIDMSCYMPFLMMGCSGADIKMVNRTIANLSEITKISKVAGIDDSIDAVVNCSGLGARELCDDRELTPVKGQVLRIKRTDDAIQTVSIGEGDHNKFSMVVPRENDIVLGGTFEEHFQSPDFDAQEIDRISNDCGIIEPRISKPDVIGTATAMRPVRTTVRLEAEQVDGKNIVHNYGHGGAGVTLSWGCADDVVELIQHFCQVAL